MHFSTSLVALPILVSTVLAANTVVNVGAFANGTAGLIFDPSSITAAIGDTVTFQFHPKNHTVTQSTFANPCTIMPPNATSGAPGGINSGFMPVAAGTTTLPSVTVNVTVSTPLWFYCEQTGHCSQGMVFAINAPTTGNTFDKYLSNALATAGTTTTSIGTTGTTNGTTGSGTSSGSSILSPGSSTPSTTGTTTSGSLKLGFNTLALVISALSSLFLG